MNWMKDNLNYIDEFYKSNLAEVSEKAGSQVWRKLYWALFWMRNKWFVLTGTVILLLGLGAFLMMDSASTERPQSNVQIETTTNFQDNNSRPVAEYTSKQSDITIVEEPESTVAETSVAKLNNIQRNNTSNQNSATQFPKYFVSDNQNESLNHRPLFKVEPLPFQTISINMLSISDSLKLGDNRRTDLLPESLKKTGFMVSLFAGLAFNSSILSGYNNEYLSYREVNESGNPGWSIGADIRYQINNWTLGTGLTYSVYRTRRDYNYTYSTYDAINSYFEYDTTFVWVYDAPDIGKPIVNSIDSSWVKVYNENIVDNSGYNDVSYLEIPVLIGYKFKMNRWNVELNTGFSVGFLMRYFYKVPDLNNYHQIVEVTHMNRVMFDYLASVTLYYQLDGELSLFVAPGYKQNLQSIFKNNYPVKEQLKAFGLILGVSYSF